MFCDKDFFTWAIACFDLSESLDWRGMQKAADRGAIADGKVFQSDERCITPIHSG